LSELIKSVEEFHAWTNQLKGRLLVYRGMADTSWEVSASACRRIEESSGTPPLPIVFQNYMKQLLESAESSGFRERESKSYSDLELLAELQHNGAATCLIDFTTNALIALWFACEGNSKQDGKVIAMATGDPERFSKVTYERLKYPINNFLNQNKLWKWVPPSHLGNRIIAQQSVFVFGQGKIGERDYEAIEIEGNSKKGIFDELEKKFGIKEQYLFSDFTGFSLSNAHDRSYSDYTAEDHFHLGLRLRQQGRIKKAIDHYDKAIELNPQDAEAYYNRGNAKRALGDHQGAITDFDKAIELNPKDAEAYNNRGNAKADSGNYQEAIIDYNKAIELNPQDAKAYYNRGNAKKDSDDHRGAITDYNKAIELNPQIAGIYNNRGVAKGDSGDYQGSIADFDKAIQLNPQYAEAYKNRGIAKQASGDEAGTQEDFAKAKELANKTPK